MQYLTGEEVAKMTAAGAFGRDRTFVSFEPDARYVGRDQFASIIVFGTVTVRDRDDRSDSSRGYDVVIKLKRRAAAVERRAVEGKRQMDDEQFHNEILFYERLMPFLLGFVRSRRGATAAVEEEEEDGVPLMCHYFYGRNGCGDGEDRDAIVLENAGPRGYRLSDHRLFLDLDHTILALRTLAKFHGLSYRAKYEDPRRFAEFTSLIKDTHWKDNGEWKISGFILTKMLSLALDRLMERQGGDESERIRRFRTELLNDVLRTLRQTMEPREPLAVLCHGDFNRNNMLFRYDDDGRPVDVMPYDMATVRYGSPALDLSFFLYMNTDRRTRDAHWDALLDAYCAALAASLSDLSDVVRVPGRTELNAEMRECAFYGLSHVSFFLRLMVYMQKEKVSYNPERNYAEQLSNFLRYEGNEATDLVADVVQHFLSLHSDETAP